MRSVEFGRTAIIKAPDVIMGPPVMVGAGSPILQQAEAVASAAWSKFEVPKAFRSALADVNLDPSINPSTPKFDIVGEANKIAEKAWERSNPADLFYQNNVRLVSVISRFNLQPKAEPAIINRAEQVVEAAWHRTPVVNPLTPAKIVESVQLVAPQVEPAVADESKKRANIVEQLQVEEARLINVEDWEISQQRRYEIASAVQKAGAEAKKVAGIKRIFGRLVAKFLPDQHEGNISQLVRKKGPDGSLVDTEQAIKTDPREFKSEQEAKEGLQSYVALFKPAKKALKGEPLPKQQVARVLKFVKHIFAYEIFVQRIIEKRVQVSGQEGITREETETKVESSLEDYPQLAAVFNG